MKRLFLLLGLLLASPSLAQTPYTPSVAAGPSNGHNPTPSTGNEGNYYLDYQSGNFWGPKSNGVWPPSPVITIGGGGLAVGTSPITGTCTNGFVLYNNAGILGCQSVAGGGNVSNTGTPTAGQLATWTNATTIQGITALPAANFPALTGDCTTSAGALATTCTKTSGVAFGALATVTAGANVATALASALNGSGAISATTSPTFVTPALGTPASGVATNLTGTAAGLTAGTATTANALSSATTTVVVNAATAPTNGQILTATSGTAANWQSPTGGGNVSNVATPTSGQIGVWTGATTLQGVTPTGSGAPVEATSPTLVTPLLGTPTSVTLTNATGLPISTGVSGLGANVATALASALNGSGAISASTSPTFVTPILGTPTSGTLTNATGLPISTGVVGLGAGVATAAGNALSAASGLTGTIAGGTAAMGTSAIGSGACATVVTVAATNVATTDVVLDSFNGDPTAVTGYAPSVNGELNIREYPTAGNVNFKVCNDTSASITPGAITLNWRVVR